MKILFDLIDELNSHEIFAFIVHTQVPSINQLKQGAFPVCLSQDPWAPVNNSSQVR